MKTFKVCLSFVLALSLFASSCTKEENLSKTGLLTLEVFWVFDSTSNNFQEIEDDLVNLFMLSIPEANRTPETESAIREEVGFKISEAVVVEDCDKDNVLIFNANKTLTELYGAVKCNPDEPNEETGLAWSFNADETQLTLRDTDSDASMYSIKTLNESKLELELSESIAALIDDQSSAENTEGYDDFVNSSISITFTFKPN